MTTRTDADTLKREPLSDYVRGALFALAAKSENEVCGFIRLKTDAAGPHMIVHPMENVSRSPRRFFEMDDEEVVEYYRNHIDETVGVYHSHPSGSNHPSQHDCEHSPPGLRYFIIADSRIYEWDMTNDVPRSVE